MFYMVEIGAMTRVNLLFQAFERRVDLVMMGCRKPLRNKFLNKSHMRALLVRT